MLPGMTPAMIQAMAGALGPGMMPGMAPGMVSGSVPCMPGMAHGMMANAAPSMAHCMAPGLSPYMASSMGPSVGPMCMPSPGMPLSGISPTILGAGNADMSSMGKGPVLIFSDMEAGRCMGDGQRPADDAGQKGGKAGKPDMASKGGVWEPSWSSMPGMPAPYQGMVVPGLWGPTPGPTGPAGPPAPPAPLAPAAPPGPPADQPGAQLPPSPPGPPDAAEPSVPPAPPDGLAPVKTDVKAFVEAARKMSEMAMANRHASVAGASVPPSESTALVPLLAMDGGGAVMPMDGGSVVGGMPLLSFPGMPAMGPCLSRTPGETGPLVMTEELHGLLGEIRQEAKKTLTALISELSAADSSLNVSLAPIASMVAQEHGEPGSGTTPEAADGAKQAQQAAAMQAAELTHKNETQAHAQARNVKFHQLVQLVQVAEEAASQSATASAFCASASPGWVDTEHVKAYAEAAKQEAKKASMAFELIDTFTLDEKDKTADVAEWLATIHKIALQAVSSSEQAANECDEKAENMPSSKGAMKPAGNRIPCRWFGQGYCMKGSACEFSHDKDDFKEVPLVLKYDDRECSFFLRGECARGKTCKWPHGPDELAEVRKLKGVYQRKVGRDRFQPREEDRTEEERKKSPPRAPKRRREEILARRPPRKAPSPCRGEYKPIISGAGL